MAPTSSANSDQLMLLKAVQKLSDTMGETGIAPNAFAKKILELMELTAKIQQFEELAALASDKASSDEVQKWQEISLMTLKHCSAQLLEERQRTLEELQNTAKDGGSLFKMPASLAAPVESAVKLPPGMDSVAAPPGLKPPPGLSAPPGLTAPPGLGSDAPQKKASEVKEEAPKAKKVWSGAPWNAKKSSPKVSPVVPQKVPVSPAVATSCVMNLDAYDSD